MTLSKKISTDFDYIFTGSGCASLSLLMRLVDSGHLNNKKVLVIDKAAKNINDRTWCFWEKKDGFFESLVHHSWSNLSIYGKNYAATHEIAPYRYKMIRGIDFYDHCLAVTANHPGITMLQAKVEEVGNKGGSAFAMAGDNTYTSNYVFNSIIFKPPVAGPNQYLLLQHFKGFVIRATDTRDAAATFDPDTGTLMDFRISQEHGTAFVYVLPLSATEALVEYTLFTPGLLTQDKYDQAVNDYITNVLGIESWDVLDSEFGVIPMTNIPFIPHDGNVINIGTAGGQTKPSTGYTFSFIQKQADDIARQLGAGKFPITSKTFSARKFHWYDSILLNVLSSGALPGDFIFTELFRKNRITDVFRFLDNESTMLQDLRVIKALPTLPFARAAIQATKPPGSAVLHS